MSKPQVDLHHVRRGSGKPLLLIHAIGDSWKMWSPILDTLAAQREVIAIDLPGHGETPRLPGRTTFAKLVDAVIAFLDVHNLHRVDVVGSSMGARLALELARRGVVGSVVALDPGGFWKGREKHFFYITIAASLRLVRLLQPLMPAITHSALGRTLMFVQFSPKPWDLPPDVLLQEMRDYAACPVFDELLRDLAYGPEQQGMPAGAAPAPITIIWGRNDRIALPRQAPRAHGKFADARLVWLPRCGHFPHWDHPPETARLILAATSPPPEPQT